MTKEEITKIYYYDRLIEELERELEEIEAADLQSPKLDGMPRSTRGKSDPTGDRGTMAADIKQTIEEMKRKMERKRKEIYEYIKTMDDDPQLSLIILHRCINLCTWDEVAARIEGPNSPDSLRMMFHRHFQRQEKRSECSPEVE